jgi:hypothetical protein
MLVVEVLELPERVQEVALIPDERAVQQFVPAGLHPAFHDQFILGIWTPLSTTLIPASWSTASNKPGNLPSRSRMDGGSVGDAYPGAAPLSSGVVPQPPLA